MAQRKDFGWDITGTRISGTYLNIPFIGVVTESRVALGGVLKHYVDLDSSIRVHGREKTSLVAREEDILAITKV